MKPPLPRKKSIYYGRTLLIGLPVVFWFLLPIVGSVGTSLIVAGAAAFKGGAGAVIAVAAKKTGIASLASYAASAAAATTTATGGVAVITLAAPTAATAAAAATPAYGSILFWTQVLNALYNHIGFARMGQASIKAGFAVDAAVAATSNAISSSASSLPPVAQVPIFHNADFVSIGLLDFPGAPA